MKFYYFNLYFLYKFISSNSTNSWDAWKSDKQNYKTIVNIANKQLTKNEQRNKYNKKCSNSYLLIVNILIFWYNLTGFFTNGGDNFDWFKWRI